MPRRTGRLEVTAALADEECSRPAGSPAAAGDEGGNDGGERCDTFAEGAGTVVGGGVLQCVARRKGVQQPRHPRDPSVQLHAPLLREDPAPPLTPGLQHDDVMEMGVYRLDQMR